MEFCQELVLFALALNKTPNSNFEHNDDDNRASAVLIAAARYLAAHTPTARSQGQTFDIAWCLHQGGKMYEEFG